ncbi:MAG: tRNA (adenosine(37)-N6)-threonylcarbamoyltransferase complex transferase subunit TsaD [Patescibacteria group bacterium]|nr:tRNA (adenosine(37)-N6)-threonylcarbamoyltransferase complex transferase subunit TsaD [Patescibacteria group bacterium]
MNNKQKFIILGIETSCDETSAALLEYKNNRFKIISNLVSSQIPIHRRYGGIIPEIAARAHLKNMPLIIKKISREINLKNIDLIAVTRGPGLITSLLVGVETAKTLSYLFEKPLIGINHLEGHLAANWLPPISGNPKSEVLSPKHIFPAVSLIVSGGHTELGLIKKMGKYERIGQTRDDAAGECFDKVAKLLNLGYPGGPAIAEYARQWKSQISNTKFHISLPRPMIKSNDFDFSFSGLKTAVLYLVKKNKNKIKNKDFIKNVCAETQQAIIDVLIYKTIKAVKKHQAKSIFLSGGVAANRELREQLRDSVEKLSPQRNFLVPPNNLCTDNAAMIAAAGVIRYGMLSLKQKKGLKNGWKDVKIDPNLSL